MFRSASLGKRPKIISVFVMNRRQSLLAGLIVLVLALAALAGGVLSLDPAKAWSDSSGDGQSTGAPTTQAPGGIGAAELVDARRAGGEAASQAGLLTSGTAELVDGTVQLEEGTGELIAGVDEAAGGAQELANGMTELQAGVGQLGAGATEIANGVDVATEPVIGLAAVVGQITAAMDRTIADLEGIDDPAVAEARESLIGLRAQADNVPINEQTVGQLEELRDGARELSNQLAVPGFPFHDGVYTATQGAQDLSYGLSQLGDGANQATEGVAELRSGAEQIDGLATQTDEKIDQINRAIPTPAWGDEAGAGSGDGEAAGEQTGSVLSPQLALLVAALVMLAGMAIAFAAMLLPQRRWLIVAAGTIGATVTGMVALFVLATGLSVAAAWLSGGVLALGTLAAAGVTRVLLGLFGPMWGTLTAGILGVVQLGVVGWVWRVAATAEVSTVLRILADITPIHWATTSLTALGNDAIGTSLWVGVAVLAALAVVGVVSVAFRGEKEPA